MTVRALARLLAVSAAVLALGACTDPDPHHPPGTRPTTTTTRPTTTTTGPVMPGPNEVSLSWRSSGGDCFTPCAQAARVDRDGRWVVDSGGLVTRGKLTDAQLADMRTQIQRGFSSLTELGHHDGGCPQNYDGSNLDYTYQYTDMYIAVSNCDRVIPGGNALILWTDRLLAGLPKVPIASRAVLVDWSSIGGLCPVDMDVCYRVARIQENGRWDAVDRGRPIGGQLDAATTATLATRVRVEVPTLASLPPSDQPGLCPSAYDGSDITFTFHVDFQQTTVSNCTKKIPGGNALLEYTGGIVAAFYGGR